MIDRSILLIGNFLSKKGGNRSVSEDLFDRLIENGWQVLSASTYKNRGLKLLDMVTTAIRYHKKYKVANIDIFSGNSFIWAETLGFIFHLLKKPFICTLHGGNLARFDEKNPRRVRRLLRLGSKIITPSQFLRNHFIKVCKEIIWVPNAVDLSQYEFILRDQAKPKLIWIRAFNSVYAPSMAAGIVGLLQSDIHDISLMMIGPDSKDGSLVDVQKIIEDNGMQSSITIVGRVDKEKVPYWLNQGDIFINTTRVESFGVAVMEAAACGLCIVTTNVGELSYLWEDGVDALLVPPDDVYAMAGAVRRILTEPGLAQKLSTNARKKAERFDWSIILPQWENLINSVNDVRSL